MTDLNPYFVAASGALDETESYYPDIVLLDYRNEPATELAYCALPQPRWPRTRHCCDPLNCPPTARCSRPLSSARATATRQRPTG